ncbi:MAG: hypothetical protein HY817_01550 [Candidatus Abawacabacteria bacterium]|nr:hypothetical protein [Candidatus Abawacabacteria bacterium]
MAVDLTQIKNKITDVINSIVRQLQLEFPGFYIDDYVKSPKDFYLKHPKGALLVAFKGSTYSANQSTDLIVQERTFNFEIILSMKHLQTDANIQDQLDAVRLALTGFQPKDIEGNLITINKMIPSSDRFIEEENGTWIYGISFSVKASNIEIDRTDYDSLVLLNQVTAKSDDYPDLVITKPQEE